MTPRPSPQFTAWCSDHQQVICAFDGGPQVADAGLLLVRQFERELGLLSDLASRLPDPRSPHFVRHSVERLLTQQVYQILADYPDCNDAQDTRTDALFQVLADVAPDPDEPLASGSTLARFQYAYTRRQQDLPEEDRPAFEDMYRAQSQRIVAVNDFLIDTFIRTRRREPAYVILDLDPTDDPVHGGQSLSGYHGYYRQHQYFPLLAFDGDTGFPLACWLRPGRCPAGLGAVDVVDRLVRRLRQAWPRVLILVRGDSGVAGPEMYAFCESEGLLYALGLGSNAVLERLTATAFADVQTYHAYYKHRESHVQAFMALEGYQAGTWCRSRRVVVKLEVTPQGAQRRFVVSNLSGDPAGIYRGFYVQRGRVPEQPLGELKNGLDAGRLSAHGFRANALRLLLHAVAYAIVVLFREAAAEGQVEEVAQAEVASLRQRLWKVTAWVERRGRRVIFHLSQTRPLEGLWRRLREALTAFVAALGLGPAPPFAGADLLS